MDIYTSGIEATSTLAELEGVYSSDQGQITTDNPSVSHSACCSLSRWSFVSVSRPALCAWTHSLTGSTVIVLPKFASENHRGRKVATGNRLREAVSPSVTIRATLSAAVPGRARHYSTIPVPRCGFNLPLDIGTESSNESFAILFMAISC